MLAHYTQQGRGNSCILTAGDACQQHRAYATIQHEHLIVLDQHRNADTMSGDVGLVGYLVHRIGAKVSSHRI